MITDNPFFILGVDADASRIEIEREAQKLLGMLELDFTDAKTYATPLGPQIRTAELVRAAVAALRDPYRRLVAELWARHAPAPCAAAPAQTLSPAALPGFRKQMGWKP
jgi:hypothetical protein